MTNRVTSLKLARAVVVLSAVPILILAIITNLDGWYVLIGIALGWMCGRGLGKAGFFYVMFLWPAIAVMWLLLPKGGNRQVESEVVR